MMRLQIILKASLQDVLNMSWRGLEDVLKIYWRRFWRRLEDVLKTSWIGLGKTSWRCLEDAFAGRLEEIFKTSWRRLKTYGQAKYICLDQDVLKTSWDVFRRRMTKANIFVLIKTSSRHLQDVFWRWRWKTSLRRLQDIFIKTNVC